MFRYEEPLYRPPSEANSLILQATLGCSYNKCSFCVAYQGKRFRAKPEKELFEDIDFAAHAVPHAGRVFLADGDAMVLSTGRLVRILERLRSKLPDLERVTVYASPQNLEKKSVEDLRRMRALGLTMIYLGLESGDDEVLERIQKGVKAKEIVEACSKPKEAGIDLSITVILGLGGPRLSERHAIATARALDEISPRYASALTLMLEPRSPTFEDVFNDPEWRMLNPTEILEECRLMLSKMEADGVVFRSNHASNYLSLAGELQLDKQSLIEKIDSVLDGQGTGRIRPEHMRGL